MIKEIILLLCFPLNFVLIDAQFAVAKANCDACTLQVSSAITCLNDIIKKIEPVVLSSCKPCKECDVTGISDFSLTSGSKVCTERINGGGTKNTFNITFNKVVADCKCTLDCDPSKVPKQVVESLGSNQIMNCPADKQAEAMESMKNGGYQGISLDSLLRLKECKSLLPSAIPASSGGGSISFGGSGGGLQIGGSTNRKASNSTQGCQNGTTNGNMHAEWSNLQVSFTTTTDPTSKEVSIGAVTIITGNQNNLVVSCNGDDPNFKRSCDCLIATKFHVDLMAKSIQMFMPCKVSGETRKYDNILQYFDCGNAMADY